MFGWGGYNLIFTGSLRKGYVEPDRVIDLFSHPMLKGMAVTFYSAGNGINAVKKCKEDNIILGDWLSRPELEKELDRADALISIAEKSGRQMSSKIFDYMSFKKPIIHIYYDDNDVNLKYLNYYSESICIKANDSIEESVLWLYLFLKVRAGHNNPKYDQSLYKCTRQFVCGTITNSLSNMYVNNF